MEDKDLEKLLKSLPVEPVPPGLLDRVVRKALATPQRPGWRDHLGWLGEQVFGGQPMALAYRCAILLACVCAGVAVGSNQPHGNGEGGMFGMRDLAVADDIIGIDNPKEDL